MSSSLSAFMQAYQLQQTAAAQGFDWGDIQPVLDKAEEELLEVREAIDSGNQDNIAEEIGDLIFVCINLAMKAGFNPEEVLDSANNKFERRFGYIEQKLKNMDKKIKTQSLESLEELWQESKQQEKAGI